MKKVNEQEVIILVHGSITYLRSDFDDTGGEYLIKLFMENKGGQWSVVMTDEYTLAEYKEMN